MTTPHSDIFPSILCRKCLLLQGGQGHRKDVKQSMPRYNVNYISHNQLLKWGTQIHLIQYQECNKNTNAGKLSAVSVCSYKYDSEHFPFQLSVLI